VHSLLPKSVISNKAKSLIFAVN